MFPSLVPVPGMNSYYDDAGRADDDDDLGLSAMMAKTVSAATSRPARGRSERDRGASRSRSRSRSSSILRRMVESVRAEKETKTTATVNHHSRDGPSIPRRGRSRDRIGGESAAGDENKNENDTSTIATNTGRSRSRSVVKSIKSRDEKTKTSSKEKEKTKTKRKSKKIRRISLPVTPSEEKSETASSSSKKSETASSSSKKSEKKKKSSKTKKSSSSRSERTVDPVVSETEDSVYSSRSHQRADSEAMHIKHEMDVLFPSPHPPKKKNAATKSRKSTSRKHGSSSSSATDHCSEAVSFEPLVSATPDWERSPHSTIAEARESSEKSQASGGSGVRIMSNKAAEELAEAALSRVAARKTVGRNLSGTSFGSGATDGSWFSTEQLSVGGDRGARRTISQAEAIADDDNESYKSMGSNSGFRSRRSRGKNTAVPLRRKIIDEYKKEAETLQHELSYAQAEIAELDQSLNLERESSKAARDACTGAKKELERVQEEKDFLIESVREIEKNLVAKDERVKKLEQVVDQQLDTVELLERKLGKTEEELLRVEEELGEALGANEDTNETVPAESGSLPTARMGSIRKDVVELKGTIGLRKEESRRFLLQATSEVDSTEEGGNPSKRRELIARSDQEKFSKREKELDARERDLLEFEDRLKKESARIQNERQATNQNDANGIDSQITLNEKSKLMKLELENESLREKLDRVMNMMANDGEATVGRKVTMDPSPASEGDGSGAEAATDTHNEVIRNLTEKVEALGEECRTRDSDLSDALARVERKNDIIQNLREEVAKLSGTKPSDDGGSAVHAQAAPVERNSDLIQNLEEEIEQLRKKVEIKNGDLTDALARVERKDELVQSLKERVEKMGDRCRMKDEDLSDAMAIVDNKNDLIESLKEQVEKFDKNGGDLSGALCLVEKKSKQIKGLEEEVERLEVKCRAKDGDLSDALALVDTKNEIIKNLKEEVEKANEICRNTENSDVSDDVALVERKTERIKCLEKEVEQLVEKYETRNGDVERKDNLITSLKEELEKLDEKCQNTENDLADALALLERKNDLIKSLKTEVNKADENSEIERIKSLEEEVKKIAGECHSKDTELSNALALVEKKNELINTLEEEVGKLKENCQDASGGEDDGKDLLIRELQNQLVESKKQAHHYSSGSYVNKLKHQIKALKENIRGLKIRLKQEETVTDSTLKKKDDSIRLVEKQMEKLKFELERREKREESLGTDGTVSDSGLNRLIEDLEEEIVHLKTENTNLKKEMEQIEANENLGRDSSRSNGVDIGDDCSLGSIESFTSQLSQLSFCSVHSASQLQNREPETSGAMQRVSNLWSKMRKGGEPPNSGQTFPYAIGSLNND
ncbi:unnamed protein product [Pseudo-nitzschia multistriata]|uniref:Uncharacterized protein n=1 Tax=Pseudo-nitzschia multistriata TaxID=183589 RepID=A0A448ZCL4_9STRA|nr:unnamed protein product [Pseudo-nitzschia multistriata]